MDDKVYGITVFSADGKEVAWHSIENLTTSDLLSDISQAASNGCTMVVSDIEHKHTPTKREESKAYSDMTYAACRGRYEDERNRILGLISSGAASASMSGIEWYPSAWDETQPERWAANLHGSMSWNGVRHIKVDAAAILSVLHPLSDQK